MRGHNEGSIFQRPSGRWRGQITLPNGKRKSFSGKTKAEVQRKIAEARLLIVQGRLATGPDRTVEQLLVEWLENVARPSVSYHTYESYEASIRRRLIPGIGRIRLRELQPSHIQTLYAELGKTLKPRSIRLTHVPLNQALNLAVEWGLLSTNPSDKVKLPRLRQKEKTILTPEQVGHLLRATRDHPLHPLIQLLATTGMRKGEALGLKWADVNWMAGTLSIRRQVIRKTGQGLLLEELKTATSRRTIPLGQQTLAVLADLHKRQETEHPEVKIELPRPEYQDLIFHSSSLRPCDPATVWQTFQTLLEDCGLPKITVHALRDTAATSMLIAGIDAKTVAERLGHSDVSVTLRVYSHVTPSMHRAAAERLEGLYEESDIDTVSGDRISRAMKYKGEPA